MKPPRQLFGLAGIALAMTAAAYAKKASNIELAGVSCQIPPPLHCPAANCPSA